MDQLWLITVPNNKQQPAATFKTIKNSVSDCPLFHFEMPNLVVGTLDTLMSLSDELAKVNGQVENVVRKVERQYMDIKGSGTSSTEGNGLRVNENPVESYLRKFQWDFARYQYQGKQLNELVGQIQSMAAKIDDELKMMTTTYTDKTVAMTALQRKKTIVVATSDFEDFLAPETVAKLDILDTEHLLTVMVAVPKSLEDDFLAEYKDIGSTIAVFGGPDWEKTSNSLGTNDGKFGPALSKKRASVKGSPVVPKSAKKVAEEGDGVLFAMTILRGHYEAGSYVEDSFVPGRFVDYVGPLKTAFREKKFVLREFSFQPSRSGSAGGLDVQIDAAMNELKQVRHSTIRWCKANFGEVYSAWIHLKVLRAFVESVLRYGLPVDYTTFFLQPNLATKRGGEGEIKKVLTNTIEALHPELRLKKSLLATADEEAEEDSTDNLPYVCHKFPVIGASSG